MCTVSAYFLNSSFPQIHVHSQLNYSHFVMNVDLFKAVSLFIYSVLSMNVLCFWNYFYSVVLHCLSLMFMQLL